MSPQPVYQTNMPVSELRTAELFVLTALRLWAAPHRDPTGIHRDWRDAFTIANLVDDGQPAFDALFTVVANATTRGLDVRCTHCAKLGEDEGRLLQLVSLLQRRRSAEAEAILNDWLAAGAAPLALPAALRFSLALAGIGLVVPLRHSDAGTVQQLHPMACVDRGQLLLH